MGKKVVFTLIYGEKKTGAMEHPRYTDFRIQTISVITRLQCRSFTLVLRIIDNTIVM